MNRVDAFRSSPLIDAIGWALLHSLWEGAAVALARWHSFWVFFTAQRRRLDTSSRVRRWCS